MGSISYDYVSTVWLFLEKDAANLDVTCVSVNEYKRPGNGEKPAWGSINFAFSASKVQVFSLGLSCQRSAVEVYRAFHPGGQQHGESLT